MHVFTSIVAPLAITGNLLAQILESGTSRGNDCPLCLDQTSHSSNDPSFHLQVKVFFVCKFYLLISRFWFLVFGAGTFLAMLITGPKMPFTAPPMPPMIACNTKL